MASSTRFSGYASAKTTIKSYFIEANRRSRVLIIEFRTLIAEIKKILAVARVASVSNRRPRRRKLLRMARMRGREAPPIPASVRSKYVEPKTWREVPKSASASLTEIAVSLQIGYAAVRSGTIIAAETTKK
jgi:hypothetical protein